MIDAPERIKPHVLPARSPADMEAAARLRRKRALAAELLASARARDARREYYPESMRDWPTHQAPNTPDPWTTGDIVVGVVCALIVAIGMSVDVGALVFPAATEPAPVERAQVAAPAPDAAVLTCAHWEMVGRPERCPR